MKRRFVDHGDQAVVVASSGAAGPHHVSIGDDAALASLIGAVHRAGNGDVLVEIDGLVRRLRVSSVGDQCWIDGPNGRLRLQREQARRVAVRGAADAVNAPMTGRVVVVHVAVGDVVTKDQPLVVVEAMKMEQPLRAPRDGVVAAVHCETGQLVDGGVELVRLAPEETP